MTSMIIQYIFKPTTMKRHKFKPGRNLYFLLAILILFYSCNPKQDREQESTKINITIKNPIDILRHETLISIESKSIAENFPASPLSELLVFDGDQQVPSQVSGDKLVFMVNQLAPNGVREFAIRSRSAQDAVLSFPKRTQAELSIKKGGHFENRKYIGGAFENVSSLRVPDEHTDHSFYIRYEGPGWESDMVGFRFYLDWRNATDVFGKKTEQMIMQNVGLDGFDSYHEMQTWGMDVLKVGSSLGLGTIGTFYGDKAIRVDKTDSVTCQIVENGNIYSSIKTNYYGWKKKAINSLYGKRKAIQRRCAGRTLII